MKAGAEVHEFSQISLNDKLVEQFISAQEDLTRISEEIVAEDPSFSASTMAKLETIAKKHGFTNFAQLKDTAGSLSLVLENIDHQGKFHNPIENYKKELEAIRNDKKIDEIDRKLLIEEFEKLIRSTVLPRPENIQVVLKHLMAILKSLDVE